MWPIRSQPLHALWARPESLASQPRTRLRARGAEEDAGGATVGVYEGARSSELRQHRHRRLDCGRHLHCVVVNAIICPQRLHLMRGDVDDGLD